MLSPESLSEIVDEEEVRPGRLVRILRHHVKGNQNKNRQTLFFFHGSMSSMLAFSSIYAPFMDSFDIVAYDAFGCGGSDKPLNSSAYTTTELVQDAMAIFDKYASNINVLIGHSYGTAQVARVCAHLQRNNRGNLIKGVVLLGSMDVVVPFKSLFQLPVFILNLLQSYLSKQFVQMALSKHADESLREQMLQQSGQNNMEVCKYFYLNFEWATSDEWKVIASYPLLLLQGEDDQITPMAGTFLPCERFSFRTFTLTTSLSLCLSVYVSVTDLLFDHISINQSKGAQKLRQMLLDASNVDGDNIHWFVIAKAGRYTHSISHPLYSLTQPC